MAQGLLFGIVAGCASMGGPPALTADAPTEAKVGAVEKRAQARWQALIDGNLDAAYAFLSPGSRSTMSVEQYKQRHRVGFYRSVRFESARCEGEVCMVKLVLTYDTKAIKGMATPVTEKWVIEDGQAWFVEQR